MSTIPIRTLLTLSSLRQDQGFNSLAAAYATTQRKSCGKCVRKPSMVTCKTLLQSLINRKRQVLLDSLGLPADAELNIACTSDFFGIQVK